MPRPHNLVAALAIVIGLSLSSCVEEPEAQPTPSESDSATYLPAPTGESQPPTIANGSLAESFPVEIIALPPEAEIVLSTAEPQGNGLVNFSLVLRTTLPADQVLQFYRESLTALLFTELATPSAEGIVGQGKFTRSQTSELIDIAITDIDGNETVSIGGQVVAAST